MTTINDLPDEVLEFIIELLPPYRDVENCQLVCRRWEQLVRNVRFRKTVSFQRAVTEGNLCWKEWQPPDPRTPVIAGRYSHSATVYKDVMYVFGGGSSEVTTFNDLWAFNLSSREWSRCNSHGAHPYPSPKARATMVSHEDRLVVFGGLRYPPSYPPYQRVNLFDELHVYNLKESHWMYPKISTHWPPAMAGHSATIHGRQMVIFGGLQETPLYVACSHDVWILDLANFTWKLQETSSPKPAPRIDHYQIRLDEQHLLIAGGLGGVNNPFTDMWLLTMTSAVWQWREIPVRKKKFSAARMWTNPSCHVDGKLIVLGQNCSLPKDLQITAQIRLSQQIQYPRQQDPHRLRNPHQEQPHPAPEPPRPISAHHPRVPTHHLGMLAFRDSCAAQEMRERRLSALQKREQELLARRGIQRPPPKPPVAKRPRQNCEAVFICDLAHVLDPQEPFAEWLETREGGILPGAPLKTILSTLAVGNGELIMFGGLEQNANHGNYAANNHVHFITVPHTVI
ncbi:F-box only protein 42 [Phlebotomus argentipes]|uniref:F-box only protein 42 n=1 Tax=Phlebotomus argentipes TaxID=94469 RepID=UPI0028930ABC|nr:F-box only protein 42 [Phlebotomus argentipes]